MSKQNITNLPKLHCFWHNDDKKFPELVQLSLLSALEANDIYIWTLNGDEYHFDDEYEELRMEFRLTDKGRVHWMNWNKHFDMPVDDVNVATTPDGKVKYISGFADYARYVIGVKYPYDVLWDTDVVVLRNGKLKEHMHDVHDGPVLVLEDSFHPENETYNVYPVNGIYKDNNHGLCAEFAEISKKLIQEGNVKHGSTGPKLFYNKLKDIEPFELMLKYKYIMSKGFFELGYDEIDRFTETVSDSTLRRLRDKDVIGIHCWMSILKQSDKLEAVFAPGTLLWHVKRVLLLRSKFDYDDFMKSVITVRKHNPKLL